MEVKPAKFAEMCNVTRQAISTKIKNRSLVLNKAGFIDTDNPTNARYYAEQKKKRKPARKKTCAGATSPATQEAAPQELDPVPPQPLFDSDAKIAAEAGVPEELLNLPLRDLIVRFGGMYGLDRHTKILQNITAANDRYQRTQERGLKLIPKDFVQGTTIQFLKNLARQILEYPEGAADDIIAKVQAHGADAKPEIIQLMRDGLGRVISGAREEVIRDLEMMKGKPNEAAEEGLKND